jgi:DNA-binding CsgD family transcriptional regulator/GAF domain-containing protein
MPGPTPPLSNPICSETNTDFDRDLTGLLARSIALAEYHFQSAKELKRRLAYERMLTNMSALALSAVEEEPFLNRCVAMLGQAFRVTAVRLCKADPSAQRFTCCSEWVPSGGHARRHELQDCLDLAFGWDVTPLINAEIVAWTEAHGDAASERESPRCKSLLAVPLFIEEVFWGFIALEDDTEGRNWAYEDKLILQTAAEITLLGMEMLHLGAKLKKQRHRLKIAVSLKARQLQEARRKLHDEIKSRAESAGRLLFNETLLEKNASSISELNAAFSRLLRQREKDLQELEERIVTNLRTLIDPALCRLRRSRLTASQEKWLSAIESHLSQIVSPLTTRLAANPYRLTRAEIRVAELIRQGKATLEIAGLMGITKRTVEVHRHHIRRKFNITRQGVNLKVFLQTLK